MKKNGSNIIGAIFIIFGGLLLLQNMGIADLGANITDLGFLISRFWPLLFLIIPGLIFHWVYFSGRNMDAGLLVPGGILLVLGAAFQVNMLFGLWHVLWPAYIMSVAVGLFELYIFGNRDKGLLIPIGILSGVSVVFFTGFSIRWLFEEGIRQQFLPLLLILLGLIILLKGRPHRGGDHP